MTYCETGIFEQNIVLENGCDSTIVLDLTSLEQPVNDLDINLCEGDTIFIGTTPYTTTGQFSTIVQNSLFCDSLVNLDLTILACEVESSNATSPVICHGESTGSIQFSVNNGDPPFIYLSLIHI